ncbi:MAG: methyltransferase domain-containing protein [Bacteroidales bacterium]|jgi:ubiquinone/menaquinone biosynthesis C-methylase UbiE|nr:methyltransferase domain-containing protein [Bacteroidales bacterium]
MNENHIKQLLSGASSYSVHFCLLSLSKLGLLKIILKDAFTIKELASKTQVDEEGLKGVINALISYNILLENNGKIIYPKYITEDIIDGFENWLRISSEFIDLWENLDSKLKLSAKKNTNIEFWNSVFSTEEGIITYSKAFEWIAKLTGQKVNEVIKFENTSSIIDLGTGSGLLLLECLKANPSLKGVGVDFNLLNNLFDDNTRKYNLQERVEFIGQNIYELDIKSKFDLVIISWVLHDLNDENSTLLLSCAQNLLSPNGRIIVIDSIKNSNCTYIELSSVEMYLSLGEGKERTIDEFKSLFESNKLMVENIFDNIDYRKIIVLKSKENIQNYEFNQEEDVANKLHLIPASIATIFGNKNGSNDIDIAIILKHKNTFKDCISSVIKTIEIIDSWNLYGLIFPTIELKSFMIDEGIYLSKHILLYASPWLFESQESPEIKNKIKETAKIINQYEVKEADDLLNYFDLIQKVTNSLILLLNRDSRNILLAEKHAFLTACYVKKWAPIKLPSLAPFSNKMTLSQTIQFYSEIL